MKFLGLSLLAAILVEAGEPVPAWVNGERCHYTEGDRLPLGTVIRPQSLVVVRCEDGVEAIAPIGVLSGIAVLCPPPVGRLRGETALEFNREAYSESDRLWQWTRLPGGRYQVSLYNYQNQLVWETTTENNFIRYDESLRSSQLYRVVVEAIDVSGRVDPSDRLVIQQWFYVE